ncbi:MAG TPA: hypothetical protein VKB65_08170, partial [Myxococcota bacterium]|nr:hypothetical protein [Myxococcota bacterium]
LAILSVEFAWARRWLRRLRDVAAEATARVTGNGDDAGPARATEGPARGTDAPARGTDAPTGREPPAGPGSGGC